MKRKLWNINKPLGRRFPVCVRRNRQGGGGGDLVRRKEKTHSSSVNYHSKYFFAFIYLKINVNKLTAITESNQFTSKEIHFMHFGEGGGGGGGQLLSGSLRLHLLRRKQHSCSGADLSSFNHRRLLSIVRHGLHL